MLTVLLFCASVSSVHLHPFTYFHFFSFHKFTYFFTYLFHTLFLLSSPSLSFIAVNFISIVLLPPSRYLIIYLLQFIYFYPCRFVYSTSVCMYVCVYVRTHAHMQECLPIYFPTFVSASLLVALFSSTFFEPDYTAGLASLLSTPRFSN